MSTLWLAVLIMLHGPGNQVVWINPEAVVSTREPRENEGHFQKDIKCLVFTNDGKFTPVMETCKQVKEQLESK